MKHKIRIESLSTKSSNLVYVDESKQFYLLTGKEHPNDLILNLGISKYLYATVSVEPIKNGNWFYNIKSNIVFKNDSGETVPKSDTEFKIIATDDPKLTIEVPGTWDKPMPQLQQSFLKEFVNNPDGEWEVEYMEYPNLPKNDPRLKEWIKPKLNQENEVNITSVEEKMYSLQEHKHDLRTVIALCKQEPNFRLEDWIKENL